MCTSDEQGSAGESLAGLKIFTQSGWVVRGINLRHPLVLADISSIAAFILFWSSASF
jgi:hypothetical protein